jgi:hypothetical protein
MSLQQEVRSLSIPASADLSASQFCFVAIDTNGRIILPATAGDDCVGVLQDKPDALDRAGQVGMLNMSGRLKVVAGATLAPGDKVQADTSGHAIEAASGDHVLGTVLSGGDSGEIIEILPSSRMLLP